MYSNHIFRSPLFFARNLNDISRLVFKNKSHAYYQAKKEIIEATPEEKIERLEMQKARLMTRKIELEKKIAESRRKQEEQAA